MTPSITHIVQHVTAARIREISVRASVDPRTVRIILAGGRVRGMADDRVRRTLAELGIAVAPSEAQP